MRFLKPVQRVLTFCLTSLLLTFSHTAWSATSVWGFLTSPLKSGHLYLGSASGSLDWELGSAFNTFSVNSGYQWPIKNLGNLAVELNFHSSITESSVNQSPNGNPLQGSAQFQSFGIDSLYRTKGAFYGLAKVGFYQTDTDFDIPAVADFQSAIVTSRLERSYNAGLGVGWRARASFPIGIELTYSTLTHESNLASLRLFWHFQRKKPARAPYFSTNPTQADHDNQTISSSLAKSQRSQAQQASPQKRSFKDDGIFEPNAPLAQPANLDGQSIAPKVTNTPSQETPSNNTTTSAAPQETDVQGFGKSLYNAERTAKSIGCRSPKVSLLRTSWPKETYQAECSTGKYYFIACEWGSCQVLN